MAEGSPVYIPTRFPLTAMVGCDDLVLAVACALSSRHIRAVLVSGPPGTGKSTAVRAAASLSGRTVVELPLNATAEQVFGTVDIDVAVTEGRRAVTDSLLRRADGGLLVADNVNLLPKGLLHSVLDAVRTGIVRAELDGTSVDERCDTVLLATMDPSEAELSQHELDRFDICVGTGTLTTLGDRLLILERSLGFERDPAGFAQGFEASEKAMRDRILSSDPDRVHIPEQLASLIPGISAAMGVESHRGDIATAETAKALAALDGATEVSPDHLKTAVRLCMSHRSGEGRIRAPDDPVPETIALNETDVGTGPESEPPRPSDDDSVTGQDERGPRVYATAPSGPHEEDVVFGIGRTFRIADFLPMGKRMARDRDSGRRGLTPSEDSTGRCVGYIVPRGKPKDVALGATIRMAAPHQTLRSRDGVAIAIEDGDIREKVRVRRRGTKMLFVVDGSGSMGAEGRMTAVKGAILSILEEAYRRRDMVGLVVFRGERAEEVLPMTRSVSTAKTLLERMPVGGRTPLVSGMQTAYRILKRYADEGNDPVMILLTDGWGNVGIDLRLTTDRELELTARALTSAGIRSIVVDTEPPGSKFRRAPKVAAMLGTDCITLEQMDADRLTEAVMSSLKTVDGRAKKRYTETS